ncbi:MAG: S9 family peptidase [candidate division Zixibacteria bacterium]|nr:S9 family peptidase [candidate division Zixibacteria bacterium]
MFLKSMTVIIVLILLMPFAFAENPPKIDKMLNDIDKWVTTDTTKILAYIDSANTITKKKLMESKYWESTSSDLAFLLGIDYIGDPRIDNTGRIYFTMRITGESEALFYADKPMGWPNQMTPNNWTEEGFTVDRFYVHPDGDYVLVLVGKFGDEMQDIWYFSRDGKFRPLLEDRTTRFSGIQFDRKNPDIFYLYTDNRKEIKFAKYTISAGKLDIVYSEPGAVYPVDYRDGKIIFVRSLSFSENQIAMLDLKSGKTNDLSDVSLFWGADFLDDGKIMTLTSIESKEDEFMKFCLLDPQKPKKFKVIYDPKKEVDDYTIADKEGAIVAALNNDGYSELVAFDKKGKKKFVPQPDIGVINSIASNDNGNIVYSFSSPKIAPTAFKISLGDKNAQQIGKVSTFGFDFSDIDVKVIRYKSDDGWEIPALLYIPSTAKRDGFNPAIVNYHGGPPGQSQPYFQRNIAYALSKGFVVMYPNVRGSTGYGPAYEASDNLEGRFASLVDCERALDYIIDEGWSKPDKIAVWGGSYGGYVVNWLATNAPEKFACAVSIVGVSDVDHTNQNSSQVFAAGWEREMGSVGSDLTRKLSPIFMSDKSTKPILVTAGYNDPRVPPSDPRRFAYVLSKLNKPVWYYEETEAGHGSSFKSQAIFDYSSYYVFTMMYLMD